MSRSPLETFLPGVKASDGPFALLGIAPEDCTAGNIDAALRTRLRMIDAHRQGNTPEADELRAALHTAAAHLHHPTIRAAAIERFGASAERVNADELVRAGAVVGGGLPVGGATRVNGTNAGPMNGANVRPVVVPPGGSVRLPPEEEAYRDLVVRVLVHAGGWNETAKRRLAAITHLQGRPIRHLQGALRLVALTGPSRKFRPSADAPKSREDERREKDPTLAPVSAAPVEKRPRRLLMAASILFTINSVVLLVVFAGILRERMVMRAAFEGTSSTPMVAGDGDSEMMSGAEARGRLPGAGDVSEDEPIARLAAIRGATRNLRDGGGAATGMFDRNFAALASSWDELDAAMMQAFVTAVSDFVGEAARRDVGMAIGVIDTVARGSEPITRLTATPRADQLRQAAFSIAMLSRLQRDRDLPAAVREAVRRRLSGPERLSEFLPGEPGGGPSFEDGQRLALRALAARITPATGEQDVEPWATLWRAWLGIADAAEGEASPVAGARADSALLGVRLDALEYLLRADREAIVTPAALESARLLAGSVEWTDALAARRLLRWHDTELLRRDELNALLGWLAAAMPDRIGSDLILPASALPAERAAARDRLALALGAAVSPAGEFDETLVTRGNALIDEAARLSRRADNPEALLLGAALASFNEASARRWIQDRAGAEVALELASIGGMRDRVLTSGAGVPTEVEDLAALTAPATGDDGEWALRVLQSERDRDTLAGLLNQVVNVPRDLGPADAGVLVDVALANFSTPIRDAAQRAIRRYAAEAPLMEALLQHSAQGRRGLDRLLWEVVRDVTGADVPHWSDPRFPLEARRALLRAHIARITEAREPGIEALSQSIRRSYEHTARSARMGSGLQPEPEDAAARLTPGGARPDPARAATALAKTYQTIASLSGDARNGVSTLSSIATRRRARLTLARDGVQRFHAEQVAAAELLAHIVADEQPSLEDAIERVLQGLADARSMADSITHQVVAAEAAMAELWIMRLGYHDARRMVPDDVGGPTPAGATSMGRIDRPARADGIRRSQYANTMEMAP